MHVTDPASFVRALRRVNASESSIAYDNEDGTLRFVIAHNDDGSAGKFMAFDVCIANTDSDGPAGERLAAIMALDHDVQTDEFSDCYDLETFELPKDGPIDDEELQEMIDLVNKTYAYKICPCDKYLIKDKADLCFFCEATGDEAGLRKEQCPICLDDGYMMHLKKTSCCGQLVHRRCTKQWSNAGKTDKCALCRGPCDERPSKRAREVVIDLDDIAARISAHIIDSVTAQTTTPGDTTPGDTTPEGTTPEGTTPGDTTPGDTTPGDTTPGPAPGDDTDAPVQPIV